MNGRHFAAAVVAMLILGTTAFIAGAAGASVVADAVMKGDITAVRKLLLAKADVNAPQVDGATALHWAVYHNDLPTTDLLLKAGADVTAANREGATPLMMASLYGNAAIIERLLKAGADAKERGPNGETTVMLAARNGNPSAIKVLVAAGADVNAKEALRATTALMWAAQQGHAEAARSLIELGANVAAKSGPAGLPRNYMSSAVPVQTVEAAAKRRRDARAAGRTYEEQLAFEQANGTVPDDRVSQAVAFVASGAATIADVVNGLGLNAQQAADLTKRVREATAGAGAFAPTPGAPAAPAANDAAAAAAAADRANQQDIIIAGLVGGGSGGLTPLVFAAREGNLDTAKVLVERRRRRQPADGVRLDAAARRHQQPQLPAGRVPPRARRRSEYREQGRLDAVVSGDRQPEHRRRRLSGAEAGHGQPGVHQAPARPQGGHQRARQREHAQPDDLHDAVVLRARRDRVRARRAIERCGVDEAAARARRRSESRRPASATPR